MKCDEVRLLQGPFLDSELDARTTLEVGEHLKTCAECARLLAEEQKREARIKAGLNRGQRSAALWERIERSVAAVESSAARPQVLRPRSQPTTRQNVLWAFGEQLRAGWHRSRLAWSGLAAVWVVIVALNFSAREAEGPRLAEKQLPRSSEVRFAVEQKRLLMADLAALTEPVPADKAKTVPTSPRSDRRKQTLNT
jgi:anti-sigma factor RsiW